MRDALKCALNSEVPDDLRTIDLIENLLATKEMRADLPEGVWNECLRVVLQSG